MKVIGLTGGIGSGKSTVSHYLEELGAVVIDADKVGHEAFQPDTELWRAVVGAFGRDILAQDGSIDRARLGRIVFNNPEKREQLNAIMHPGMKLIVIDKINALREKGASLVVLEAFGLIEAGWQDIVDQVWLTTSSEETVVKRLEQQRGLSREQVLARIHSQTPNSEREKHADVVIRNDGSPDETKAKVKELWAGL